MKISVEALVNAPVDRVWSAYTTPEDIRQWNAASDDRHTTKATVDLRVGGAFSSRMEARAGKPFWIISRGTLRRSDNRSLPNTTVVSP
jgi:uncharacterized protein YndB with AHSA1/START domain